MESKMHLKVKKHCYHLKHDFIRETREMPAIVLSWDLFASLFQSNNYEVTAFQNKVLVEGQ